MKKKIILFIALFYGACSLLTSQVVVTAELDSVAMLIGEQSKLSIKATQPESHNLQFPVFSDTIVKGLDLVSTSNPDTQHLEDGTLQVTNNYIVTAFDSALIYMPGFKVVDGEDTLLTNPLTIKIIDMPVDTTQQAITDIKGIYKPPFNWIGFLTIVGYVLLAILVVLLTWYLIRRYLRNKTSKESEEVIPVDPRKAHEIAFEQLELLRNKKLWQASHFKEYYTSLTEIIRQYIYRRYGIGAMEQTSDELLSECKCNDELKDRKEEIKLLTDLLQVADLVKFAKFVPLPPDCERSMTQSEQFVDMTKLIDSEEETKKEE